MTKDSPDKLKIPLIGLLAVKNFMINKEDLQKGMSRCSSAKDLQAALKKYFLSNKLISSQNMERLLQAAKAFEMRKKEFKFGAVAIRKGFINKSVLKLALEEQEKDIKNSKSPRLVGDLLVEAGMFTPKQRDDILRLQKRLKKETKDTLDQKENKNDPDENSSVIEEDEDILLEPEIISGGIKLEISKDFMAAFLTKTESFDKNITLAQIHEALFDKGIILGIVDDKMILGFINSSGFKTKSFRVAQGITPIQGKDARVEFFFNTDYLKAGGFKLDGTVDFKDRGETPYVEEGTVLAEKVPMLESRHGQTIFGDEIETVSVKDIALKFGKGAKISEDGFKILAEVTGYPKYTLSGYIFVHSEYITEGDVDYETGHIHYDGNVNVKGRIKAGFKVTGNDITAIELDGGIITAEGDVIIAGGINEANIYARGNVYARFIHNSKILCMGSVVIQKEIVDSDIDCSGSCVVENGKLMSSRISAKMGLKAKNVGTEMAGPSVIRVGHDVFCEKELEKNREKFEQLEKQAEQHREDKEKLDEEYRVVQKKIADLAQFIDKSQQEEKEINLKISLLGKDTENDQTVTELKTRIDQLKTNAQKAEKSLDAGFVKSEKLEEMMAKEDMKINALEKTKEKIIDERTNLVKSSKDNPGKPVVIIDGVIMPETLIVGNHSEKRVMDLIRYAKIMEVVSTTDDGQNIYEMRVTTV
ncbi:FapA family protein [Desulfobacula phenolica]|uniref:Flagellar Assembly Protein A N-terminal region domain-containing protein n=1 Tax=Desulfobacula phenolica TaxID=90732 RepID=A0A1H2DTD6_9BACT|nr:FapA family protein [Desulfobacula phenolica]SDT86125.1 hypothetical protein SAMN04487931_102159 [Desulfobacula phenolica]